MYGNRHIVDMYNTYTQGEGEQEMPNHQKNTETKLVKGLLDFIILQILNTQPMHGYQIITQIRKSFGVYFGPSTIYPLLCSIEKKGCISSEWNMESQRPRKIYSLTKTGHAELRYTENSLVSICKRISATPATEPEVTFSQQRIAGIKEV
jgi:PadR family transcriptional regulator PadR